jgi:hypothetical protein
MQVHDPETWDWVFSHRDPAFQKASDNRGKYALA